MTYRQIPRFDCQKERSELQAEDPHITTCPGNADGVHCGHLDTHDSCCDCDVRAGNDGIIKVGQ